MQHLYERAIQDLKGIGNPTINNIINQNKHKLTNFYGYAVTVNKVEDRFEYWCDTAVQRKVYAILEELTKDINELRR